ncbi:hypothetical protein B7486_78045 [cyanobacterium TDX16]|nr:hypothetical protein B7486_78045 [cyanobacterium TDX16]
MDSRRVPGPATLRHHDALVGVLRTAGFDVVMAAHAFSVVDAYLYGFTIQEDAMPVGTPEEAAEAAQQMAAGLSADDHPHLSALVSEHIQREGYDYGTEEFEWGLDLILDGIEQRFATAAPAATPAASAT